MRILTMLSALVALLLARPTFANETFHPVASTTQRSASAAQLQRLLSQLQATAARVQPLQVQPITPQLIRTRIISPAIEADVPLRANGRLALVTGMIACDEGEQVRIRVRIIQQSTGAEGEGHTQAFCTGDIQTWTVKVVARGPATFEAGAAQARAWASTRRHGKITDTFQWDRAITLEPVNQARPSTTPHAPFFRRM